MYSIVYGRDDDDRSAELATVIAEMEFDKGQEGATHLVYEATKRFPRAVAEGVLRRLREGRPLPRHATELMAGSGIALEDDAVLNVALEAGSASRRAAAEVVGHHD